MMNLNEFKEIADELNLSYYKNKVYTEYSITLDNLEVQSHNHIATWYDDFVVIYDGPYIVEERGLPEIRCGSDESFSGSKGKLKKYILDALNKYKELKKELRFRKIMEL